MQTECSQDSFDFASLGSRKVTASFDGGAITSNAGALLLREGWPQAGPDRTRGGDTACSAHPLKQAAT